MRVVNFRATVPSSMVAPPGGGVLAVGQSSIPCATDCRVIDANSARNGCVKSVPTRERRQGFVKSAIERGKSE